MNNFAPIPMNYDELFRRVMQMRLAWLATITALIVIWVSPFKTSNFGALTSVGIFLVCWLFTIIVTMQRENYMDKRILEIVSNRRSEEIQAIGRHIQKDLQHLPHSLGRIRIKQNEIADAVKRLHQEDLVHLIYPPDSLFTIVQLTDEGREMCYSFAISEAAHYHTNQ